MKRSTSIEFVQKAHLVHGNRYAYDAIEYIKSSQKVSIGCKEHGYWQQRPNDHLRGDGCPSCKFEKIANGKRHTKQQFVEKAIKIHGDTYDYSLVVYKNAITKIEIICPTHGKFLQTPDKHLGGGGCAKCSNGISKGERLIQQFFDTAGIEYEREKRFDDLVGSTKNSRLRYDFFLPTLNLLIEYDGEHHFEPIRTKGRISKEVAIIKHEITKTNDITKNKYAANNGYELIRISYKDFNRIDELLFRIISQIPY